VRRAAPQNPRESKAAEKRAAAEAALADFGIGAKRTEAERPAAG
jgi:hypothetical protein